MSPSPNIADLLRQRQMMDQFNQITSQGTQAAMMQPGIQQFDDTQGGSSGGQGQPYTGLPTSVSRRPTVSRPAAATPGMTYEQAQGPGGPQLIRRSPSLMVNPDGNLTVGQGNEVGPFQLSGYAGGRYNPNALTL